MTEEAAVRKFAHKVVDRADIVKVRAILDLLDEDYISAKEEQELLNLAASEDWTDWRDVRPAETKSES